jgi:hypothetical protein
VPLRYFASPSISSPRRVPLYCIETTVDVERNGVIGLFPRTATGCAVRRHVLELGARHKFEDIRLMVGVRYFPSSAFEHGSILKRVRIDANRKDRERSDIR